MVADHIKAKEKIRFIQSHSESINQSLNHIKMRWPLPREHVEHWYLYGWPEDMATLSTVACL